MKKIEWVLKEFVLTWDAGLAFFLNPATCLQFCPDQYSGNGLLLYRQQTITMILFNQSINQIQFC